MIWFFACTAEDSSPQIEPHIVEATAFAGEDFSIQVDQEAFFDAGESTGVLFEWNFGDGQTAQGFTVNHRFSDVGHHQVVLTSFAADGQRKVMSYWSLYIIRFYSSSSLFKYNRSEEDYLDGF